MADFEKKQEKPPKRILRFLFGKEIPPVPEDPGLYPEPEVSWYSKVTFSWIYPLLRTGYLRTIQPGDLWKVQGTKVSVHELHKKFDKNLEKYRLRAQEKARKAGNLTDYEIKSVALPKFAIVRALHDTFFFEFWLGAACKIIGDVAQTTSPLVSRKLINFVAFRNTLPLGEGIGYCVAMTVMLAISAFFTNLFIYFSMTVGCQVRAVLCQAIYNKSLKLSNGARSQFTNGKMTNLIGTDCFRIDFAMTWFHFGWTTPISMGICIAVVCVNIGGAGMVGIAFLFVLMGATFYTARVLTAIRKKTNLITDQRVSIMREILGAMKVIKFYSWEDAYEKKVSSIRAKEVSKILKMITGRNLLNAVNSSAPVIAGLLSFVVLERTGHSLNAAKVFSTLSTFNITRMPLNVMPLSITTSFEGYLAICRIQDLLSAPEFEYYLEFNDKQEKAIIIDDGEFIWEKDSDSSSTGSNSTVAGSITDEKKALESDSVALESEGYGDNDDVASIQTREYANSVSNAAMAGSLVEKTESHSQDKAVAATTSQEIIEARAVFTGFKHLNLSVKKGELIIITGAIGSGKSSLLYAIAGGMKRIHGSVSLNGKIVLCGQQWVQNATVEKNILFGTPMDRDFYNKIIESCSLTRDLEILPAGDQTEVGEQGIAVSGGQKARINLARAAYCNADIILLDDVLSAVDAHVGKHIMENCIKGILDGKTRLLATHQLSMLQHADRIVFCTSGGGILTGSIDELSAMSEEFTQLLTFNQMRESVEEEEVVAEEEEEVKKEKEVADTVAPEKKKGGLMQDEDRAVDSVNVNIYLAFFRLGGGFIGYFCIPVLVIFFILYTFFQQFNSIWLSFWTEDKFHRESNFYIGLYVMFGLLAMISAFTAFYALAKTIVTTSFKLHDRAVNRVLHAPMSFFDTSPLGRVLNRFSKDTDTIDTEMTDQTRMLVMSFSNVGGVFILIIVYVPYFAIALAGLSLIYILISGFYRSSAREFKRLDSLLRSVVFSHFGETLTGIGTIKAYHDQDRFIARMEDCIDDMNGAYYLTLVNQRWLTLRLDYIGTALTFIVTMLCTTGQFNISAASSGVVISSLLAVINMLSMLVRQSSAFENEMNSVERIYYYGFNLPQEAAFRISETAPPKSWPSEGAIEFKDIELRYRPETPAVLHGVSLSIGGGEKIGICGRTGAGKSTIMTAIYRLVELTKGSIEIDGIDISKIGLNDLRTKLSIIPQDPVLFNGTIRTNLDPFELSNDEKLLDALKRSWLITQEEIDNLDKLGPENVKFHLDAVVQDDGSNFSLGERQLIALARALVRESKILILDEATSSVDFQTDHQIQTTITSEFSHCTILCIAHRLNTILGYDKILVLDAGTVAEFDSPATLFNREDSIFRSMCDKSGIDIDHIIAASEQAQQSIS